MNDGLAVATGPSPKDRTRDVHGALRVVKRVRLVAAESGKNANHFISGIAGVKLVYYPFPITFRLRGRSAGPLPAESRWIQLF
jgi:hypothetical protein